MKESFRPHESGVALRFPPQSMTRPDWRHAPPTRQRLGLRRHGAAATALSPAQKTNAQLNTPERKTSA
jgi:hypothetical protein